jgi:predicted N-acetyltransferase YhbS
MIRLMSPDDFDTGLQLCRQAGWNQNRADWHRFLGLQPDGCFVAVRDHEPVGTVTTCIFDSVAWIGMMLVEASQRGQGIGRALMEHALAFLDNRGVQCIRLDATPLGRPLYSKLGFFEQSRWIRYGGVPAHRGPARLDLTSIADRDRLYCLDRSAVNYDRRRLLDYLLAEKSVRSWQYARGASMAFLFERPGELATFIGPCLAESPEAGRTILFAAISSIGSEPVFVDVPAENTVAVEILTSMGLSVQREFIRMTRGAVISEHLAKIFASSGPEKG